MQPQEVVLGIEAVYIVDVLIQFMSKTARRVSLAGEREAPTMMVFDDEDLWIGQHISAGE